MRRPALTCAIAARKAELAARAADLLRLVFGDPPPAHPSIRCDFPPMRVVRGVEISPGCGR